MPIFQDDLDSGRSTPPTDDVFTLPMAQVDQTLRRRVSEESIRTELCEGLILDSPSDHAANPANNLDERVPEVSPGISDRLELMERLKRGESPTWVPNRHVCPISNINPIRCKWLV